MWKLVVITILLTLCIVLTGHAILNKHINSGNQKKYILIISICTCISTILFACFSIYYVYHLPIVRTTTMDPGTTMVIIISRILICIVASFSLSGFILFLIILLRTKKSRNVRR